jgi:hypothetical protein
MELWSHLKDRNSDAEKISGDERRKIEFERLLLYSTCVNPPGNHTMIRLMAVDTCDVMVITLIFNVLILRDKIIENRSPQIQKELQEQQKTYPQCTSSCKIVSIPDPGYCIE